MYFCCISGIERADKLIDYMLLEIRVFGSYESTSNYDSQSGSDFLSSFSFLGNTWKPMVDNNPKYTSVENFETHYTCEERVASFWIYNNIFGTSKLFQKHALKRNGTTWSSHDSPNPFFYLHLPIFMILAFGFPLFYLKQRLLRLETFLPMNSRQTVRGFIRAFHITC